MSDAEKKKPLLKVPRPGSLDDEQDVHEDGELDVVQVLFNVREEVDLGEFESFQVAIDHDVIFQDQRSAAAFLAQGGSDLNADLAARATWFESEAEAREKLDNDDPRARYGLWLLASELWAMLGDTARARSAAGRAREIDFDFAGRQQRQLAQTEKDTAFARRTLQEETQAAKTDQERAHAAFYAAELERLETDSSAQSLRFLDIGQKLLPNDPRASLFKLARQLGTSSRAPSIKWPEVKELDPLRAASGVLSRLRGDRRPVASTSAEQEEPLLSFMETQQALLRGKAIDAGRALSGLFLEPELGGPARWLAAALLSPSPDSRAEAVRALTELLDINPTPILRRTVAARSLEAGQLDAANQALREDDGEEGAAFSDAERIAIGALTGASVAQLVESLRRVGSEESTRSLAFAAWRALGEDPELEPPGEASVKAQLRLGSLLASGKFQELQNSLSHFAALLPEHRLVPLLALEFAHQRGDVHQVADILVDLADGEGNPNQDKSVAHYAAGLLLERVGQTEAASEHYQQATGSPSFGEAALRAWQMLEPDAGQAQRLNLLADRVPEANHKSALLEELALPLLREAAPESTSLQVADLALEKLAASAQLSPIAELLLERRLLQRQDSAGVAKLLERRLPSATAGFDGALLRVRLSKLLPDSPNSKQWLADALHAYPGDATLVSEYERTNRPDALEVARLRESLAARAKTPWSRARLLLEAALFYEQGGAYAEAARAAKDSDALATSDLAKLSFVRNALCCDLASTIKERWVQELGVAQEPARLGLLLRLAQLEREGEHWEAERQWLQEAERLAPQRIDLLVELEHLLLREHRRPELLLVETRLSELLKDEDMVPHALFLARAERVQKGWSSAHAALKKADRGAETSLYTLRQLQAQARRSGDDRATQLLSLRLVERTSYPPDRAVLLLRAAEAALRLGQKNEADELARQALSHATGHVLIHHFLASTRPSGNARESALSYEQVAAESRVAKHQAEAWYDAANLWLDEVADVERGRAALQRAAELDPSHRSVFEKLFRLLKDSGNTAGLMQLVEQRLGVAHDREERAELGMLHSQLLRDAGEKEKSRAVLQGILKERADHLPALQRLASLALEDDDAKAAEQALLQLVRLTSNWDEQAAAYLDLGDLYRKQLSNLERAERCYQEVLRRKPNNVEARAALLPLYLEHNNLEKARQQFEETLATLPDAAEQRLAFLEYLGLVDRYVEDKAYKTELLEQALALWPLDSEVLDLALRHFAQQDKKEQIESLEQHTFLEVSRKLQAGFLEPQYLQATAALSVARGDLPRARLMQAMAAALGGQMMRLTPLHGQAMQRTLDEKLAPAPMISPLRTLLMLTRDVLEHAFVIAGHSSVQQSADAPIVKRVRMIAAQAGVPAPEVCLDAAFPYACWLNGSREVQLIFGESLHREASNEELDFLIWRNVKLSQARAGVFTRLDAAQTKLATVAFLGCFVDVQLAPDWDVAQLTQVKERIRSLIPADLDDDVPVLALEALQSLTKSGEHLALAARKWANRTALLATGNINAAFSALIRLGGQALVTEPTQRQRQLADNPETRDLVYSALLPAMAEALATRR